MQATFKYIRTTANYHLYETVISKDNIQAVYIERDALGVNPPRSLEIILSVRNYSEEADSIRKEISKLEQMFQDNIAILKRKLKELE